MLASKKASRLPEASNILTGQSSCANLPQPKKKNSIHSLLLLGVIRGAYLVLQHMNKLTGDQGGIIVNTAPMAGKAPDLLHMHF